MSVRSRQIILGTRGSALARAQAEIIRKMIKSASPRTVVLVRVIKTEGDRNQKPIPLDTVGKGWFTKELEHALMSGAIDLAVHSLKDLPEEIPRGLAYVVVGSREDPREALISRKNIDFDALAQRAVIGTDSMRRKSQILNRRPDLSVKSIRGNVPTRLKKLRHGKYAALILAAAGLTRLGLKKKITHYFDPREFIPAPGQGALAAQFRKKDKTIATLVRKLIDPITTQAIKAERAFSKKLGGGCKMPIGAYAIVREKTLFLHGMVGKPDGSTVVTDSIYGSAHAAMHLGYKLAQRMKKIL